MNQTGTITAIERKLFILLTALAWSYVILRAHGVPWVNDEALTFLLYVEPGDFLPGLAAWDANNHFLNSALMSAAYESVGLSHLGSRIGSVLAFLLYAWATFDIGSRMRSRMVRWCLWSALLLCPMLIELFSLARGYGIGTACWLAATAWLMRLADAWSARAFAWVLIFTSIANAAVMVALPLWALVLLELARQGWKRRSEDGWLVRAMAWTLLGALPFAGALGYSLALRDHGGYFIGSLDGFVEVTVRSLTQQLLGLGDSLTAWAVAVLIGLASLAAAWKGRASWALLQPVGLLMADALSRAEMAHFMDVNYPIDRAAAHLVPWALITLAIVIDLLTANRSWAGFLALAFLVLPVRTLLMSGIDRSALFPMQGPPEALVRHIAAIQAEGPTLLGGPRHMGLTLALEARRLGLEAPRLDGDLPPSPWFQQRITWGRVDAAAATGFHIIDSVPATGHYLLERIAPLTMTEQWKSVSQRVEGDMEYIDLLKGDTLMSKVDRVLEFDGVLDSGGEHAALNLVVAMNGADGHGVYYESYPIHLLRPRWKGERLRLRVPVPVVPDAVDRSIYIWNIKEKPLRAGPFSVVLRRLEQ